MDRKEISPQTSIADLTKSWPETIPVFLHRRMICVGCYMAEFETIEDAATNYDIPVDVLLHELVQVNNTTNLGD